MRITNVRRPPEAEAASVDERLFAEEGSAEGCASGECLPPEVESEPKATASSSPSPSPSLSAERWRAAVENVRATHPRQGAALAHGRLLRLEAGEAKVGYLPTHGFHRSAVTSPTGRPLIEKALSEHFGRPMRLLVEELTGDATTSGPSIAEQEAQDRAVRTHSTEGKVRSHPAVQAVLRVLGGEIEHIQILEPERPHAIPAGDVPEDSA